MLVYFLHTQLHSSKRAVLLWLRIELSQINHRGLLRDKVLRGGHPVW